MLKKTVCVGALLGFGLVGVIASGIAATGQSSNQGANQSATRAPTTKVALRRITESQYRHTVADLFGPNLKIDARFEPERREEGLLALGSAMLSLTSSGFEQYFAVATSISDQVLNEKTRDATVGCKPADVAAVDESCARQFIEKYGEILFRRPLTQAEV